MTKTQIQTIDARVAPLGVRFGNTRTLIGVQTMQEASWVWSQWLSRHDVGNSQSPKVTVIDTATGKRVASVSYNGRVWDNNGNLICEAVRVKVEYDPEAERLLAR